MKLSRYEQEVVITLNAEENTAQIYTAYPVWIRKMDRLCRQYPEIYKQVDEVKGISKTYECPKKYVSVRRPRTIDNKEIN